MQQRPPRSEPVRDPLTAVFYTLVYIYTDTECFGNPAFTGHPNCYENQERLVRTFDRFALEMSRESTLLYFNREDMYSGVRMSESEWLVHWKTVDLLAALGTTFEELQNRTANVDNMFRGRLPKPRFDFSSVTDTIIL